MNPSLSQTSVSPLPAQASLSTGLSAKARVRGFKLRLLNPQAQPEPEPTAKIRVCLAALPLAGADGWAAQLLAGLLEEAELSVSFVAGHPPLPGFLLWLAKLAWVRAALTALAFGWLLWQRARHCDILHVFATPHHSQWLRVAPALLLGRLCGSHTVLSYCGMAANWPTAPLLLRWAEVIVAPSAQLIEIFEQCGLQARALAHPLGLYGEQELLRQTLLTSFKPTPEAPASPTPRAEHTASTATASTLEEADLAGCDAGIACAAAEHFAWPKVREEGLRFYGELMGLPREMQYWKHAWDEGDGY